jgi:ferredoxin
VIEIIEIDEKKCNGCSQCIPNCPEGALQIIDGKARLVSDLFCDGLGACIGHCPEGAIKVVEREAEPYDERMVMEKIVAQGPNVTKAHLQHLEEHGQKEFLQQALDYLEENGIENPLGKKTGVEDGIKGQVEAKAGKKPLPCGCPGTMERDFRREKLAGKKESAGEANRGMAGSEEGKEHIDNQSELSQWPVQLTLVNPNAAFFDNADLLVSADCVPFANANFHNGLLKGKALVVGCPKLDDPAAYKEKLTAIIKNNNVKSVTVATMEVPCCSGLARAVEQAVEESGNDIAVEGKVVRINGDL